MSDWTATDHSSAPLAAKPLLPGWSWTLDAANTTPHTQCLLSNLSAVSWVVTVHLCCVCMCAQSINSVWVFETPWTPWPARLPCPWESPGKNTGVGCHSLLQGIVPTQKRVPGVLCDVHLSAYSKPVQPPGKHLLHCILLNPYHYRQPHSRWALLSHRIELFFDASNESTGSIWSCLSNQSHCSHNIWWEPHITVYN